MWCTDGAQVWKALMIYRICIVPKLLLVHRTSTRGFLTRPGPFFHLSDERTSWFVMHWSVSERSIRTQPCLGHAKSNKGGSRKVLVLEYLYLTAKNEDLYQSIKSSFFFILERVRIPATRGRAPVGCSALPVRDGVGASGPLHKDSFYKSLSNAEICFSWLPSKSWFIHSSHVFLGRLCLRLPGVGKDLT